MKWVTRERPKIDRIACPWLIARFIDKAPEFLYVPADQVLKVAKETGAVPYDIPGVEMSHDGPLWSLLRIPAPATLCILHIAVRCVPEEIPPRRHRVRC